MPTLPIRLYGDPILRAKARAIDDLGATFEVEGRGLSLPELAQAMLDTMYEARGVGLAAPQIGLGVRLFVAAEYEDDEDEGGDTPPRSRVLREMVFVNPVLEPLSPRKVSDAEEGCLSIPGIYEEGVPRFAQVRLRYQTLEGSEEVMEAEDYLARVFQHEQDHLDGRLFLDHLPPAVAESHRRELALLQRRARQFLKARQSPRRRG